MTLPLKGHSPEIPGLEKTHVVSDWEMKASMYDLQNVVNLFLALGYSHKCRCCIAWDVHNRSLALSTTFSGRVCLFFIILFASTHACKGFATDDIEKHSTLFKEALQQSEQQSKT